MKGIILAGGSGARLYGDRRGRVGTLLTELFENIGNG